MKFSKWFLLPLAVLAWAPSASCAQAARARAGKQPNVLFILSDDQRADTIAALGNKHIQTPNLDRLVKTGFVFHRAYCMGSTVPAVCMPSRSMMMTGRTLFRLPATKKGPVDVALFPSVMRMAGYATLRTGKPSNYPKYAGAAFDRNIEVPRSVTCSSTHADNAIRFIRDKREGKPFFLLVALGAPHDPRVAPKEFMDRYKPGDVPLPPNYRPQHPFNNGEMTVRDEKLAPWPRTRAEVQKHLAEYYADITYMDHQIGRILQALEETGQLDNTILVFTSDHGLAIGSHGLFGKQNLYEHSMRVPMIFAGPGIPRGKSSTALVYLLDIFPTVTELVGAKVPASVEGKSLASILRGKEAKVRDSAFFAYRDVQRAVCDARWKLIRYPQINRSQLFDLKNDPHELKDLASDPGHAERMRELMALLQRWQRDLGDTLALTSARPLSPEWAPPGKDPKK
ncbi:MAG: sulfatase-like hydrolase/transferase [Gemmataceae bacterium]|nr:sulfatase-like hydrolase/transferase [Gemmataceae bacterium]